MSDRPLALITGGTSGIGFGVAKALAADCDLALSFAGNTEKAEVAKKELVGQFPQTKVQTYGGAVSNFEGVQEKVEQIKSDFGRGPSVLVNSAGRISDGMFLGSDFQQHVAIINEHLLVTMAYCHQCLKDMYRNKFGRIINMSSISARYAKKGQANYAAAKAGIEGFTRTLAIEVAHRGVTVNAIAPGLIETPMTKELLQKIAEKGGVRAKIPNGKAGDPDELGGLVRYLSQESSYITGQVITFDGGRALGDPS